MSEINPGIAQGFPEIAQPLVDQNGVINQTWLQLLIALWNRTGQGSGVDSLLAPINTDNASSVPPVGFEAASQGGLEARIADLERLAADGMLGFSSGAAGLNQLIELTGEVTGRGFPTIPTTISTLILENGTYTPTLTNLANISASTAYVANYFRVKNMVTVFGRVDIDPTAAATLTQLRITLPIASNLTSEFLLSGTAACRLSVSLSAAVYGDSVNDLAILEYVSTADLTNVPFNFIFSYQIN